MNDGRDWLGQYAAQDQDADQGDHGE